MKRTGMIRRNEMISAAARFFTHDLGKSTENETAAFFEGIINAAHGVQVKADHIKLICFKFGDVYRVARFDRLGAVGHNDHKTAAAAAREIAKYQSGSDLYFKVA